MPGPGVVRYFVPSFSRFNTGFCIFFLLVLILFTGRAHALGEGINYPNEEAKTMKLTSPEFGNNQFIPAKFSCEGEDVNPSLFIEGIPSGTKSLALIVDDPDAPMGTWVHWVVYDIAVTSNIAQNYVPGKQGINNAGKKNYHGPCPPSGTHHYFFKIYALDAKLGLPEGVSKGVLEKAMKGHVLGSTELVGLYKKGSR